MSKAILLSVRPERVAKILNGEETIEVRKKFPKDYVGWVYIYCTNRKPYLWKSVAKPMHDTNINNPFNWIWKLANRDSYSFGGFNGKVVARFWCDKVEEIVSHRNEYETKSLSEFGLCDKSCLTHQQLFDYLKKRSDNAKYMHNGYAIHISKLEVFDRPKELWKFYSVKMPQYIITKAPQNYCYIEGED